MLISLICAWKGKTYHHTLHSAGPAQSFFCSLSASSKMILRNFTLCYTTVFPRGIQYILLRFKEVFQRFRKVNIKLKPSKCHFSCHQVNYLGHALASLLCLQELDDFVRQTEKITTQDLVGFNNLPCCISTELSAQHSTIPSLKATVNTLDSGFPLHARSWIMISQSLVNSKSIFYSLFPHYCQIIKMEALENVRSAHVFDLTLLKEFYSVFGIYYKIHSFREIFIG